jgi:hypothetical protein
MSSGSGAEFGRSDHVSPQHYGGEASPRARYPGSGTEHLGSGSEYVNTNNQVIFE